MQTNKKKEEIKMKNKRSKLNKKIRQTIFVIGVHAVFIGIILYGFSHITVY
jgi:hypothetical protein